MAWKFIWFLRYALSFFLEKLPIYWWFVNIMRLLFAHDHIFKTDGQVKFSSGSFPASVWDRYISIFGSLTVVGRNGGVLRSSDRGYSLSSIENVDFCLIPNISNLKSLLLGNEIAAQECIRLVSEHDALIARLPSRIGQMFVAEAIKQGKPYSIEVVGCALGAFWNHGSWKGKLLAPFAFLKLRHAVLRAPFVLYVTKDFLQKRYPCRSGKTTFCSNVEIPVVDDSIVLKRKEKINSANGNLAFGLIGNYSSKYKGIDVAIRALAIVDKQFADWEFQVVGFGDPSGYSELSKELGVSNKVKFIGSLPSGQPVFNWIDGLDIYLQPSLTEGLPRALVEVMSRGCPAIGSNVGAIPELLRSDEMVDAGDYTALAETIMSLISNESKLSTLATLNFIKAKDYYKPVLEERRISFLSSFRDHILSR